MDAALIALLGDGDIGRWSRFTLQPEAFLWRQHADADGVAWLASGTLDVVAGGAAIGTLAAPALVGEAGGLLGGVHGVGLRAQGPCEVHRLDALGVARLRSTDAPAYARLLDVALEALATRVRSADRDIAERVRGELKAPRRVHAKPSLWSRITSAGRGKPAPLLPALRRLPRLENASLDVLEQIFDRATPRYVPRGQALTLEGDAGREAWILASGRLQVLRHIGFQSARRLAWLNPGALLGVAGLLTVGPRTASIVASEPSWVYAIGPEGHEALDGDARRVWRESLLASLAAQIRGADRILAESARVAGGPSLSRHATVELPALLDAAGQLVATDSEGS